MRYGGARDRSAHHVVCADLQTFHKTRKQPKGPIETFAGKTLRPEDYIEVPIDTEDFGAVMFRMGDRARGAFTASQVSAGRKNRLSIEIYGTKCGVAWDQERPDELWIGQRNSPTRSSSRTRRCCKEGARSYADLPAATAKATTTRSSRSSAASTHRSRIRRPPPEYPQFVDGLRQLTILEAELASNQQRAWVDVPA